MADERGHFIEISPSNVRWFEKEFLDKDNKSFYGDMDQEIMSGVINQDTPPALLSRCLSHVTLGDNPNADRDLDALDAIINKESQVIVENGTNDWSVVRRWSYLYREKGEYRDVNGLVFDMIEKGLLDAVNAGGNGGIVNEAVRLMPRYKGMHTYKMFSILDSDKTSADDIDHNSHIKTALNDVRIGWHELQKRAMENYFDWDCYVAVECVDGERPKDVSEGDWDYIDIENYINKKIDKRKRKEKYIKSMLSALSKQLTKQHLNKRFAHIGQNHDEVQCILLKLAKII